MKHLILALAVGILLLTLTIELLRRRSLREEYAWPWLSLGIVMLVLALWPGLLHFVGEALQPTVTSSSRLRVEKAGPPVEKALQRVQPQIGKRSDGKRGVV
jgi:type VI protein secretion system component VasK